MNNGSRHQAFVLRNRDGQQWLWQIFDADGELYAAGAGCQTEADAFDGLSDELYRNPSLGRVDLVLNQND